MTARTLTLDTRSRIFWTLVSLAILASGLYVYAVASTVSNTVSRKNLEAEAGTLGAKIGEMEFAYIGLKNKVSMSSALEHGYSEVTAPVYASRLASRSLSVNLNR